MTSERSKRRDFLSLIFISKSISKKLLIKILTFNIKKENKRFLQTLVAKCLIVIFDTG